MALKLVRYELNSCTIPICIFKIFRDRKQGTALIFLGKGTFSKEIKMLPHMVCFLCL